MKSHDDLFRGQGAFSTNIGKNTLYKTPHSKKPSEKERGKALCFYVSCFCSS
jgi:hypothetical protein